MLNIEKILKQVPHNPHYLNRYIKFIKWCKQQNFSANSYVEKHHILPKAKNMFPEYASFTKYPENCVVLPYRHHVLSHWLLLKAYDNDSTIVAYMFTTYQKHARDGVKPKNSRNIEKAKRLLSEKRRGVFSRGYDQNGVALVSEKTKQKLSILMKNFYSDPENRKKQSIACTGSKKSNTEKITQYARNRTEQHQQNLVTGISSAWKKKIDGGYVSRKSLGVYVTPYALLSKTKYCSYCVNLDKRITIHSTKGKYPKFPKSFVGHTPRELGFSFIPKGHLQYEKLYAQTNQVDRLEPNHLLLSLLGDFPLREMILQTLLDDKGQ